MNVTEWCAFLMRVGAFLITFWFMIDYLHICDLHNYAGYSIAIIAVIIIVATYYPLRGKHVKVCKTCGHRYGYHKKVEKFAKEVTKGIPNQWGELRR